MKPTDEQIKEFWEWCGLKKVQYDKEFFNEWQGWSDEGLVRLRIDPNNLFKYAVPKFIEEIKAGVSANYIGNAYARLFERWQKKLFMDDWEDPALALFWVIYEVMKLPKGSQKARSSQIAVSYGLDK